MASWFILNLLKPKYFFSWSCKFAFASMRQSVLVSSDKRVLFGASLFPKQIYKQLLK